MSARVVIERVENGFVFEFQGQKRILEDDESGYPGELFFDDTASLTGDTGNVRWWVRFGREYP